MAFSKLPLLDCVLPLSSYYKLHDAPPPVFDVVNSVLIASSSSTRSLGTDRNIFILRTSNGVGSRRFIILNPSNVFTNLLLSASSLRSPSLKYMFHDTPPPLFAVTIGVLSTTWSKFSNSCFLSSTASFCANFWSAVLLGSYGDSSSSSSSASSPSDSDSDSMSISSSSSSASAASSSWISCQSSVSSSNVGSSPFT